MNVILLKDVEKLGHRGEVVNVARGYARNFLLPRNLAEVATEGRVKEVQRIDAQKAMSAIVRTASIRAGARSRSHRCSVCGAPHRGGTDFLSIESVRSRSL